MRPLLLILLFIPWSASAGVPFPVSETPGVEPAAAALSDSSAVVVYEASGEIRFSIPGSVTETPLAPPGSDPGFAPDVAPLSGSGFVAVWIADDGTEWRPLARIFDGDGNPAAGPVEIGGSGNVSDISVAAGPAGSFVVTWSKFWPPDEENVFVRAFGADGLPVTAELQVNGVMDAEHVHPKVAVAPDGGFTVAWGTFSPLISTIRARSHSAPPGSWSESWLVAENAVFPTVAADGQGRLLLTWASNLGKQQVWGRRPQEAFIALGGSGAATVGMAMHPTGAAAVTWHEGGLGAPGLLRARFLDTGMLPVGEVVTIAEDVMGTGNSPGVTVSVSGRVFFAWEDHASGLVHGRWWDEPIVPVAGESWGSLKSLWR